MRASSRRRTCGAVALLVALGVRGSALAPRPAVADGLAPSAPRRAAALFDRRARRIARALDQAATALADESLARAAGRLRDAERGIRFLRGRLDAFAGRGVVAAACAAVVGTGLDGLAARVAAVRTGSPPPAATTTTLPAPATSSSTSSTSTTTTTLPGSLCGNGRLDRLEQCDGTNLFGRTCLTLGFPGGELRCGPDCLFDVRGCASF